jgi:hypothetical protein
LKKNDSSYQGLEYWLMKKGNKEGLRDKIEHIIAGAYVGTSAGIEINSKKVL